MKMLDLSKFDKVKEEKDHVTMRHRDGIAEMRIFLKGLPKIQQEQLKRLKMAKGGKVAHYDDGTPDAPVSQDDASSPDDSQNQQAPATTININAAPAPQAPAQQPAAPSGNQPMAGTTPVQSNPAAAMAQAPVNVNPPAVPATPSNLNPDGTMNPAAVAKNTQTANQLGADINAAKAQGAAQIEQNYIDQAGKLAQIDQQNLNDVKGHADALNQYVQNNPIDPKHWAESQSTPQKIMNAFGLLAGGFTGGFNGTGQNGALNFINQQIDRDIQGQKDRMGQQKTVYDAYHQIYVDSVAANAATKASMLDIYNHQFNLMAAKLGTPQAAKAAMEFGANAAVEKSKLLQDAAVSLRSLQGYAPTGGGGSGQGSVSGSPGMGGSGSGSRNNNSPQSAPSSDAAQKAWDSVNAQIQAGPPPGSSAAQVQAWQANMEQQKQQAGQALIAPNPNDRILTPEDRKNYEWALSKYNHVQSPEDKAKVIQQYEEGSQTDKALADMESSVADMQKNKTISGNLAQRINPHVAGGIGVAAAEALTGGGGGGIGAVPVGLGGAAIGEGGGALLKQVLRAIGGQQETRYENAEDQFDKAFASRLTKAGLTPTRVGELISQYHPTAFDEPDVVADKLKKAKKIVMDLQTTTRLKKGRND